MSIQHKLLLADDSLTIQKVVELVLVHENFEIKSVNDGEQALGILESYAPDIILADIEMPKLNGYQLCEKVKNNASTVHIPVVLLAGAFEPFDEEYAKAVGADDYIIKPFESQELISKVKSLLVDADAARGAIAQEPSIEEMQEQESGLPEEPVETADVFSSEELKWDEDISTVSDTKEGTQETVDEEYEARVALSSKGFADELTEALKQEREEGPLISVGSLAEKIQFPDRDEVTEILKQSIHERVLEAMSNDIAPQLSTAIKESVEQAVSGIAPGIIESVTREAVKDLLSNLRGEVNAAIGRLVPEIAETIIKKEIEKITSEL